MAGANRFPPESLFPDGLYCLRWCCSPYLLSLSMNDASLVIFVPSVRSTSHRCLLYGSSTSSSGMLQRRDSPEIALFSLEIDPAMLLRVFEPCPWGLCATWVKLNVMFWQGSIPAVLFSRGKETIYNYICSRSRRSTVRLARQGLQALTDMTLRVNHHGVS